MAQDSRTKTTIYVGGLDMAVNQAILHSVFEPFGEIIEITLPKPEQRNSTDPHRGFGYVEFEEAADAKEAIDNVDQSELYGRVLKCSQAKSQRDPNEGLASRTAIWEQEDYLEKHNVEDNPAVANGMDPMQGLDQYDVAGPKDTS